MNASKDTILSHDACSDVSHTNLSGGALRGVRISTNVPAPEEWTLVREANMEKREPCEVSEWPLRQLYVSCHLFCCRYGDLESFICCNT